MKVNDPNLNGLQTGGLGSGGVGRTEGAGAPERSGTRQTRRGGDTGADQVQLSNLSRQIQAAGVEPPERLARIDKLREDFAAGRYQPDPRAVSRSLIADAMSWRK